MNRPEKVIYTAKVHTTGGRVGASRSDDGRLEVKLSRPGTPGAGTNPEQLFAAGWSACYESAMELVARRMKIALPADLAVDGRLQCRGASQYQPARRRAGRRAASGGCHAPRVSVFPGDARQHRGRDQAGLSLDRRILAVL
jgi:OsmC-like protein